MPKVNVKTFLPDHKGLKSFEPIEGTWSAEYDPETQSCWDAVPVMEEGLASQFGFPVKVELFHSNGHAITDNSNEVTAGSMLVTRQ